MRHLRFSKLLAIFAALLLTAAACGGDDDDDSAAPADDGDDATEETSGDSEDASGSGADECAPLEEMTTVTVSVSSPNMAFAPLYLGDLMGEFEQENIEIEYQALSATEALAPMAQGDIDMIYSTVAAGQLNAISRGIDVRWVAPLYSSNPDSAEGLYARADMFTEDGEFDWSQMEGKTMATQTGFGSVLSHFLAEKLFDAGVGFDDFSYESLGTNDILLALETGAIDAGWLSDPVWLQVQDNPDLAHAFSFPEPNGTAVLAGPGLNERPEVGRAYFRALARTIDSYLQEDSIGTPEVREALAEALETTEEDLPTEHARIFDPELSLDGADELVTSMQETFIEIGDILEYDEPIPAEDIVDRSYVDAALACA